MARAIEFHFDFVSPYSYLADTQLPKLARQHGGRDRLQAVSSARADEARGQPADDEEVAARLDRETAAAAERGVFGSPSFFVGDELYFGNDRLDFVAAALTARKA
jgi:2-hydroxychromene-2-carboxylate isomerase